ncbi:MFS transporter [Aeromonas hydrophila]|uniref:MFS transporter n=1 Tax=Aeromonas hydrophila TaxID=644 RepID=UPI002B4888D0|nr:MFS transporter [Aeromonas hydrophila]
MSFSSSSHASTSAKASSVAVPSHGLLLAILTLGMGGLFIGTGEFASMSLLPDMAQSTGVSIPVAGSYISAYALGVVVGAPLIAALGARWERKMLLLALLALAVVGYVASACAWDHVSLFAARFVSGLPHGAYYGVAALVAAAMVPTQRRAQAIGYVMLGLAAANVIGVPTATWLGQSLGWRSAFGAVGLGCVLTAVMMMLYVPRIAAEAGASARTELGGLKSLQLWLTLGVASIGFGGMFAVYSYITPTLTEVTGLELGSVPMALATWGMGMIVGNLVGGWLADRALIPAIFGMLVWNIVFLGLFSITASSPAWALVTLFLIGNGFALVPALQAHLMQVAGKAQTLAAALNHSAFNASNAIGATLGGLAITKGMGWASTGWVGGALAFAGLLVMLPVGILASRPSRV